MSTSIASPSRDTQWTRGAWLTLAAAILFVVLNVAHLAYRMTIPSLGWAGPDPETLNVATPYFELDFNAVRVFSTLEPGDKVQAIEGITPQQVLDNILNAPRPANWRIGETVQLNVLRDDQTLSLKVPLVQWTLSAWWKTNFYQFDSILNWLVTLLVFGVGAFTFIKRPGNLSARFLFAFGLAILSIRLGESIPDYSALYFDIPAGVAKLFFSNVVFAYLIAPSYLGYALTFPKPKSFIQRQPRWLLLPYLIGFVPTILLFINPKIATIGFLLTFGMLLLGVLALVHSGLTMRDAVSKAQFRWAIGGVITGAAVFMLNFAGNLPSPFREIILFVASLGIPIIGFSLAIATLRYRLFDIDVIIRKTLLYTILTLALGLSYFGSVVLLQVMFEQSFANIPQVVIVFSTLLVAALFNPLRRRIKEAIDRRFYRKKYNAEHALAEFSLTANQEVELNQLSGRLIGVVEQTVQPDGVWLWIRKS